MQKNQNFFKKSIDKRGNICYNSWALCKRAERDWSLKIEQHEILMHYKVRKISLKHFEKKELKQSQKKLRQI